MAIVLHDESEKRPAEIPGNFYDILHAGDYKQDKPKTQSLVGNLIALEAQNLTVQIPNPYFACNLSGFFVDFGLVFRARSSVG